MTARWRYVVPNLLTCVSISLGLLAISQATSGNFDGACWSVLLCVLLDKADGTAARLLKASSEFGMQMDSLSDLITFGIAPATICLAAFVGQKPIISLDAIPYYRYVVYIGAFLFAICGALRLAKFNVLSESYGDGWFFGAPTTISGAVVCCYFLTVRKYGLPWPYLAAVPAMMIGLALLMVSRFAMPKVGMSKSLALNIVVIVNLVLVYAFGIIRIYPEYLLFAAVVYLVVSLIYGLVKGIKPPPIEVDSA